MIDFTRIHKYCIFLTNPTQTENMIHERPARIELISKCLRNKRYFTFTTGSLINEKHGTE